MVKALNLKTTDDLPERTIGPSLAAVRNEPHSAVFPRVAWLFRRVWGFAFREFRVQVWGFQGFVFGVSVFGCRA